MLTQYPSKIENKYPLSPLFNTSAYCEAKRPDLRSKTAAFRF